MSCKYFNLLGRFLSVATDVQIEQAKKGINIWVEHDYLWAYEAEGIDVSEWNDDGCVEYYTAKELNRLILINEGIGIPVSNSLAVLKQVA